MFCPPDDHVFLAIQQVQIAVFVSLEELEAAWRGRVDRMADLLAQVLQPDRNTPSVGHSGWASSVSKGTSTASASFCLLNSTPQSSVWQLWANPRQLERWWGRRPTRRDVDNDVMNSMKKYVVSNSLQTAESQNSELIRGDMAWKLTDIKALKGGDITMSGSAPPPPAGCCARASSTSSTCSYTRSWSATVWRGSFQRTSRASGSRSSAHRRSNPAC
jgi:hypothetical protein